MIPWGVAIAAVGTIAASSISSSATSDAASAQQQSSDAALAQNQRQFDTTQANEAPWLTAGGGALGKLSSLYGISSGSTGGAGGGATGAGGTGSPSQVAYAANSNGPRVNPNASFYLSPDYQFAKTQGLKGITAAGAAGSGTDNGATRKAEIGYAGNLASGQYQDYKNGLLSLAGLGQTTSGDAARAGQASANTNAAILTNQGNNQASSYLGQGQIASNAVTGLGSIAQRYLTSNDNIQPVQGMAPVSGISSQPIASYTPVSVPGF